ncbi:pleckstrin homology domain-containing family A member 4 [Taeniopygia guttata]|uniref:pleckstrin homology domain-containing family A member 4 n=1 Tax=Taeniopygia guttata TaxID=59729 RepID=UPI003BB89948
MGDPPAQPCRPVPRVHAFGKGEQALRRDPRTPPAMQGWLHKQDSSGLRLWKRRWFVLVDLCLYYYRDSSEQQVRGGLPLPGYEIRVLPAAPRAPQFLFTAEHAGMRTYCLGAETPEELHAWVCALRRGASPLPGSARSLSLQALQESRGADPPSPPLPTHCPAEGLGGPPVPPPCCPPVPALPHSKAPQGREEPPARGCPARAGDTAGTPRRHPETAPADRAHLPRPWPRPWTQPVTPLGNTWPRPLVTTTTPIGHAHWPRPWPPPATPLGHAQPRPLATSLPRPPDHAPLSSGPAHPVPAPPERSPRKPRPLGAALHPPPQRDTATNQPPASPTASSDWLPRSPAGTAPAATSNEASRRRERGAGGRGLAGEGVGGRPIRITLLQASF